MNEMTPPIPDREADATLKVKHPPGIDPLIGWSWTDDRPTLSPTEFKEVNRVIEEAEDRHPPADYESGTLVATIWMDDDETVDEIKWELEGGDE